MIQTLEIRDRLPSKNIVVDPRAVFTMLGERATHASWQVAAISRYDEALMIVGNEAADRLEAWSRSQSRVSGTLLGELLDQVAQIIWGEFTGYEKEGDAPWIVIRAIDSSWCEVETDDKVVLDCVRKTFSDVRLAFQPTPEA